MKEPKTLKEAIEFFADPVNVREYMIARRWSDGKMRCPTCGSNNVKYSEKFNRWQCASHHPKRQFTLKVGTIFEDSPIGLDKWLLALWMLVNCKNGVSSYEIHRNVGVTQKSAWFMLQRLRKILEPKNENTKLGGNSGPVELDETFIGGRVKNMHASRRNRLNYIKNSVDRPDPYMGKTVVFGMLDRDAREVRATVVANTKREALQTEILKNIKYGSTVYTDEHVAYDNLHYRYVHDVVNHMQTYVKGRVHTNGIENFWSLLKRGLKGTYVAVEPFHLDKYVDEQVFRFNNRATKDNPLTDGDRFRLAVDMIAGHRLTYKELTGKLSEAPF